MRTRAAVLREVPGKWQIEEVELDEPKYGELLVEMVATGLCHSDDHYLHGDTTVEHFPLVGGHEGAGIVRKVGVGVTGFEVGDHVLTSFIPACGKCRWCAEGKQNLCDFGAKIMRGDQFDGTFRMHTDDGLDVATMTLLGTFAEYQVFDQLSLVKIDEDLPLEVVCLVSCCVQTGFGSATDAGGVRPGDVVLVAGVGGVGMNAVQGARESGAAHIIVADPEPSKQKWAYDFGCTESFASIMDAMPRIQQLTNGQGADVTILTPGLLTNQIIGEGLMSIRKGGTLVVTAVSNHQEEAIVPSFNGLNMSMMQKRIQGVLFGNRGPRDAMPKMLNLYRAGKLKLDELVTKRYTLDQINEAYDDMRDGKNIRGVVTFR
ncbi:NDMA-dependent alcohol dehydrogenase [Mycobacterium sp. CBMA293]|uniref:NDMA-dependent alcohol dehydrogenase n=1 Tax=unclassified Mycolicibacterium TaxID=2636767 RepID=UPI0012DDEBE7|nr:MULTISPECIES: NDMA-dependent alcohol dehydrogenase [unclassified Mycolicibacterium]MUL49392.1 NDMA-dependent alcohol dehydrogenase [Mycolicibacterium sp. CBMA 360]MUL62568.1 NDMA-dependent alcohol dehydrogenase [Mycolicibacterium sp. CBMA 335]MUL69020.1 NDMA-dependent alcohol dehydrogenase [Mycolicibacterium sp. CBMA 311]MUL96959.1 NDMA-dependent alcohol dehydrogenase [Mycolicibacterium sp. CBMA 230]MUM04003.1 alcohol dehydrogenase [Mycolicibacterium sp. CBMA 213]